MPTAIALVAIQIGANSTGFRAEHARTFGCILGANLDFDTRRSGSTGNCRSGVHRSAAGQIRYGDAGARRAPEMARFHGAWVGTWHDDRHILVVERVKPDGHASVVFAQADSAFYNMNREWWRDQATIVDGVLTMTGFRTFRYAFDGQDRLYLTAALK